MAAEKARLEKARDAASDALSAAIDATKKAAEAYEQSRLDLLAAEQSKIEAAVCGARGAYSIERKDTLIHD